MERLQKTAKTLDTIVRVCKIFVIISLVASLVALSLMGVACLLDLDANILGEADYELELGSVKLSLSPELELPAYSDLYQILTSAVLALAMSLFALIAIKYILAILHPMTEGEPFRDTVAVNLKKLAWLTIIYGAVRFFLTGLEDFLITKAYADVISQLIDSRNVTHVSYEHKADMTFLLVAGVLFLLSHVFRYAQELQKQADETL